MFKWQAANSCSNQTHVTPSFVVKAYKHRVSKDAFVCLSFAFCILSHKMKLRSRARRVAIIIKREDCSLKANASSIARVSVSDANTLGVKQDTESCTLVKQEEPFTSALVSSNLQVDMDKTIKQEETSKTKAALGTYAGNKLQGK